MIINFKKKEQIICKIGEIARNSISAVIATLEGVVVNEMTQLRRESRNIGVYICVVRNTLLHRVVENTSFVCLKDFLVGQNVIAFSNNNISACVRIFIKFSKTNVNFKIKGAVFEGKFIDATQIDLLSNLPTYKESLFNLALIMKMGSIGKFIRILYMLSVMQKEL